MQPDRRYLTSAQTCARYGGKSVTWLWRRVKHDPSFPKPLKIHNRLYFEIGELDAYDDAVRASQKNDAVCRAPSSNFAGAGEIHE
jgi:predicted DNA-binding transcriptional regulator AlpA